MTSRLDRVNSKTQFLEILEVRHNKSGIGTIEICLNRRATDEESGFLEEVVRRAVACMPKERDMATYN